MTPEEEIAEIKRETFGALKDSRQVWMIEESGAEFVVHRWTGDGWKNGAGVAPLSTYPTLRKAASRLLQLLETGPVAPQTYPESVCVGTVSLRPEQEI